MKEQLKSAIKQVAKNALESDEFRVDPRDFFSAKEQSGATTGTQITQVSCSLGDAAQILNSSVVKQDKQGRFTNVVTPVVMPKNSRSYGWLALAVFLTALGLFGLMLIYIGVSYADYIFGPHYWFALIFLTLFNGMRSTMVEIPDGCQALITRRGAVTEQAEAGRKTFPFYDPFVEVGYIVNTTKEYPYNAPIREAPTQGRINASVDLFLQFKIEDPNAFVFTLGGAQGFSAKLDEAVSEMIRTLIYEQRADGIYDLVGESTQPLLQRLNRQFLPAVRFVSANITHAEPSDQQYRMDLAAEEIIKVAKEAYTYEYELNLKKELNDGELNKELGSLEETLSEIEADIATYQAKIDTAGEKATNRANAYAQQLLIEAESEANANAALLQAQALDIKALNVARFPEILEYRYEQQILGHMGEIADKLPQLINIGDGADNQVNYPAIAQQMMGIKDTTLFAEDEKAQLHQRVNELVQRINERNQEIKALAES